jgi:suppressor for copper-sensitivity B
MHHKAYSFFSSVRLGLFLVMIMSALCFSSEGGKAKLSLISDSTTVGTEGKVLLGLRVNIAPGWKTYWRTPGISGYGPNLTWEGSKNVKSIQILWPLPHHAQTQLGQVNAYEGDLILPLIVELKDPHQPLHVALQVDMLVCDDSNCLPIMEDLSLNLPIGPKLDSPNAGLLQQAMKKIPQANTIKNHDSSPFYIQNVYISGMSDIPPILQLTLTKSQGTFSSTKLPDLFIEIKDCVVDLAKMALSEDNKSVIYTAAVYPNEHRHPIAMPDLAGKTAVLTIGYDDQAFEIGEVIKVQETTLIFWFGILSIAFLGGLILNIMPCVLPVLSLKVLSLLRHGGGHKTSVRHEFLATVLGIVFSFLVLASAAILLKISGHAVGWGVQFQDPYFLIALIGILTLFACNLFGYFEFRLPMIFSSIGVASPHREKLVGSFLEGSLVTALATPCTAPFLGTAVAFALSRGIFEIISIFFMMGLGLAFPFLLIALFPKLATSLPKPGTWMITIKHALGMVLVLTAVWLVYVLIAEIGKVGAFMIALLMLLISLVLKRTKNGTEARKRVAWLGASILVATSFILPTFMTHSLSIVQRDHKIWQPFEPERIAQFINSGKIVFVSVTADWCLTCQANKYFVLKNKSVKQALNSPDIVAMEADWTNHDPKITAYLKAFNQYGIPFYAIYGCKSPGGRFLGQVLTPSKVLDALKSEQCNKLNHK